ncbi:MULTISPECIES: P1 family peptidase [unclassified Achromobacter]|uniref:DmpA family aminopeptidase n=1 Tax=unclassified Achromobacter TaxID=2626865 RepID=UPI000B51D636|nr:MULTISPECIES: P1 family peptidase [unclassified Achromobacter]OWT77446.1 aminopeptidase [Achromobacter sp. HZ28]OWT78327.1 aminopeptidase [Achromobacter sp. HZ34]
MDGKNQAPRIGRLPAGALDNICDVAGVTVGHVTLDDGPIQTGVTVLRPHGGDSYRDKVPAGVAVINGFGKSIGLVQIEELGVLETPIALTNTFGVGTVANAQIRAAVKDNPQVGREWATVNPLVFECNDGYLNDIQALAVTEAHYGQALVAAGQVFDQGAVGAGRGMSCFSFKGGIGSASRVAGGHTVGALVLANYGRKPNLTVAGRPFGRWLSEAEADAGAGCALGAAGTGASDATAATDATGARTGGPASGPEKGSIILLLATDAPLDARQLRRLAVRAGAGLARTGSVYGHGSGDIALAFSTAYTVPHLAERGMPAPRLLHETRIDPLFEAAAEATEQAIIHAMWRAVTVHGRDGHVRQAITAAISDWSAWLARNLP